MSVLLGVVLYLMSRGLNSISSQMSSSFGSMTKAKFTIIDPAKPSTGKLTSFKDVAGMEEAKKEVSRLFVCFFVCLLVFVY